MSSYPEQVPKTSSMDKFVFSLSVSSGVKSDLQAQLESLNSRIDRIVNEVLVGDLPLVKFVLQTSHDKKELKKFAKAIDRVADLIETHDKIESKLTVIQAAEKDPEWLALTFGDFSHEIENDISSLTED